MDLRNIYSDSEIRAKVIHTPHFYSKSARKMHNICIQPVTSYIEGYETSSGSQFSALQGFAEHSSRHPACFAEHSACVPACVLWVPLVFFLSLHIYFLIWQMVAELNYASARLSQLLALYLGLSGYPDAKVYFTQHLSKRWSARKTRVVIPTTAVAHTVVRR